MHIAWSMQKSLEFDKAKMGLQNSPPRPALWRSLSESGASSQGYSRLRKQPAIHDVAGPRADRRAGKRYACEVSVSPNRHCPYCLPKNVFRLGPVDQKNRRRGSHGERSVDLEDPDIARPAIERCIGGDCRRGGPII